MSRARQGGAHIVSIIMYRFKRKYFDESLDLNIQTFNLLGFAGMAASLAGAVVSVLSDAGLANIIICLLSFLLAVALLYLAGRILSYRLCCWVIIVAVFMIAFPVLFFSSGGYKGGMPCFFIFAIIYTTIMLEKHERRGALVIEFVLYVGCCIIAYFYPETVYVADAESFYLVDSIMGIVASGVLLMLVVMLHIRMYHVRQMQMKEMNRELEARNETLTKYDKMKSDFLATVAHEMSTPLAIISASSADTIALLEEMPLANMEEILENHERIDKRVMLLGRVLADLMDTTAIETGRLALSRQPTQFSQLLKTVCDVQFKLLDKNNNRIAYDLQPDLPKIWVDGARIEQVMINIISNAVRHTKGGVITVKLTRESKTQTVSVTDNGEGMDATLSEDVMKQYATSFKRDCWRHGIGLYLCRQIIASHGGDIWIDSEKGRGTKITFTLMEEPDNE